METEEIKILWEKKVNTKANWQLTGEGKRLGENPEYPYTNYLEMVENVCTWEREREREAYYSFLFYNAYKGNILEVMPAAICLY